METRTGDALDMIGRFDPRECGRTFRRTAFTALAQRYRPTIAEAVDLLRAIEFEFPALTTAHLEQLRPDLLFRQALPFCVTEQAFFNLDSSSSRVLAALLAIHTLALTQLDYHLDGSTPDPAASATAVRTDPTTAWCYAARMAFAAGRLLDGVATGHRFFDNVIDPISGFVVARMHQDWLERYDHRQMAAVHQRLDDYLTSPRSRLLGSGYWEVMIRGSFARHGTTPGPELVHVMRILRQLRQAVDEIADFDDDLRAGLVTTPLLFALTGSGPADADAIRDADTIRDAVRAVWSMRTAAPDVLTTAVGECRQLVERAGGFLRTFLFADQVWRNGTSLCDRALGPRAAGYLVLLDIKRAKLDELHNRGWHNTTTDRTFT
jgi:hypothetical protein